MLEPKPRLPKGLPAALPIETVAAAGPFFRIHRKEQQPIWFGPAPGDSPRSRFDDPRGAFRVLYMSSAEPGAFVETSLRDRARIRLLSCEEIAKRRISEIATLRELRFTMLHGPGLARVGADSGVASGPYRISRAWARALWEHKDQVDGIQYRARHDDEFFSVALFDRAQDAVVASRPPAELDDVFLADMAKRYDFGLVV